MLRPFLAASLMLLTLSGCFSPRPQVTARNWRPLGPRGLTLGQLLALSPGCKRVTWESYADNGTSQTVRVSVEYIPAVALAACSKAPPGMSPAARLFLLLDLNVPPDGDVTFAAAKAEVFDASGYYEAYSLSIGVMAAIVARTFPLPCGDIGLPSYLGGNAS